MISELKKESLLDLDGKSTAIFLEVKAPKVVVLQGFFELYEGLGLVRTIDIRQSLIALLTPNSMLENCLECLEQIQEEIEWKPAQCPEDINADNYFSILHRSKK